MTDREGTGPLVSVSVGHITVLLGGGSGEPAPLPPAPLPPARVDAPESPVDASVRQRLSTVEAFLERSWPDGFGEVAADVGAEWRRARSLHPSGIRGRPAVPRGPLPDGLP